MKYASTIALILLSLGIGYGLGRASEKTPVPVSENAGIASAVSVVLSPIENELGNEWYPVIKVVDGDTLAIMMDGKSATVRLIGLDTPETVDPRKPVQCFGKEASEKAKQILAGISVRIETDPSQGEYDKYGRLLAYVFLPDGTNFNEDIIAEGYGHEYTYNLPYKYQVQFKAAEQNAREEKKGLWADGACADSVSPQKAPTPAAVPNGTQYDCSRNVYNCSSFKTQAEALHVFELCGGVGNDIHKLDSDGDGEVCESLP